MEDGTQKPPGTANKPLTTRPTTTHPSGPIKEPDPSGATGQAHTYHVQYQAKGGPVTGCLMGLVLMAVFFIIAMALILLGGIFSLFGGRRIAEALFKKALKARGNAQQKFRQNPNDPDVIDVEGQVIPPPQDRDAK